MRVSEGGAVVSRMEKAEKGDVVGWREKGEDEGWWESGQR